MDLSSVFKDRKFNQVEYKGGNSPPFTVTKGKEFTFDSGKHEFVEVKSGLPKLPKTLGFYPNYNNTDDEDTPHWSMLYGYSESDPRTISSNEIRNSIMEKIRDPSKTVIDWEEEMEIVDSYKEGERYVDKFSNVFEVKSNDFKTVTIILNPHLNKVNFPPIKLSRVDFLIRVNFLKASKDE